MLLGCPSVKPRYPIPASPPTPTIEFFRNVLLFTLSPFPSRIPYASRLNYPSGPLRQMLSHDAHGHAAINRNGFTRNKVVRDQHRDHLSDVFGFSFPMQGDPVLDIVFDLLRSKVILKGC